MTEQNHLPGVAQPVGLQKLLTDYRRELATLEDMKARGDLTKDWGECSLISARKFVKDLESLAAQPPAAPVEMDDKVLYAPLARDGEFPIKPLYPNDEIKQLRAAVEYWRLAAERREERRERTGLDIAEARTLDAPELPRSSAATEQEPYSFSTDYGKDLLTDINQAIHRGGTNAIVQDCLKRCYREIARLRGTAPPQTPQLPCPVCGNEAIHAIDVLRRTVIHVPIAWDANHNRSYEPVEMLAKEIYDGFVYDGPAGTKKPAWTPGGNGTKQDEARHEARRRLREAGHASTLSRPQSNSR